MPLPKRVIEPIHVSRGTVPDSNEISLTSELETVTNGTLANSIRQLSSLSRHAEDLFGELARETHTLATRANSLQARLDKLAVKTTQLDSTVEEGSFGCSQALPGILVEIRLNRSIGFIFSFASRNSYAKSV